MYSAADMGQMSVGRLVGPGELVKYHASREQQVKVFIYQYDLRSNTYQVVKVTPSFSDECVLEQPGGLREFEKDALRCL